MLMTLIHSTFLVPSKGYKERSLNVLNDWKLEVNHEKSKVIVFNSNRKSLIINLNFKTKF